MSYLDRLFGLKDKVVIVTGAVGQLGSKICEGFSCAGAIVVGIDRLESDVPGCCSGYFQTDITDRASVQKTFQAIFKQYNGCDVLINNAGVSVFTPFEERLEDHFDWVMDVNLKGTFFCIQEYARLAKDNECSRKIVNIASAYGVVSPDFRNYTDCDRKNSEVYGATKAGIIQMTKYFAVHLADNNIRVNCVSPGGIFNPDDPQGEDFIRKYSFNTPMKRMAHTEEMIGAILYLASNAASYTTGQNIVIDGGMTCW
tara:strand:+ start:4250 stop:5017 length:768 start_codon:yes stop_codon:yes gene_type:complete